jgi:transcription antitermination factor NusG
MSAGNNTLSWFALGVRPNQERNVARILGIHDLETYLPSYRARRRWSDRVKESEHILFPGYVFCRFEPNDRLRILQSSGVRCIVSNGGQPTPVDEAEISSVRTLVSTGSKIALHPYLRIGQDVVIEHGPLSPLRGVIVRAKNSWRVVVSVEALGSSISVEVDSDMLSPDHSVSDHGILSTSLH